MRAKRKANWKLRIRRENLQWYFRVVFVLRARRTRPGSSRERLDTPLQSERLKRLEKEWRREVDRRTRDYSLRKHGEQVRIPNNGKNVSGFHPAAQVQGRGCRQQRGLSSLQNSRD